jgi:hypothetical protein
MTQEEAQAYLEESRMLAKQSVEDPSLASAVAAGRAAAGSLITRLQSDPAFREAVQRDPSTLVAAGIPQPAIFDILADTDHAAAKVVCNDHSITCGVTCGHTKQSCIFCTSNTIPNPF